MYATVLHRQNGSGLEVTMPAYSVLSQLHVADVRQPLTGKEETSWYGNII